MLDRTGADLSDLRSGRSSFPAAIDGSMTLAAGRSYRLAPCRSAFSGEATGVSKGASRHGAARAIDHLLMSLDDLSDEQLVAAIRDEGGRGGGACREVLFRRIYPRVSAWCRKFTGDSQEAMDTAQEVLLRVHQRLHTFRGKSRFSTWLYAVTRSVAVNRAKSARRHRAASLDDEKVTEPIDPQPSAADRAELAQVAGKLRTALATDLEPLEARVLYLHYVDGMSLPAITEVLELGNKSGAKAYIVNGRRKLDRKFGRWLKRQSFPQTH
jgi:RNA polymerase sigma-70 factor (ECF subfamily)